MSLPHQPPRIVLVEDDPIQAEWIAEQIIWPCLTDAELRYYDSEYSFLEALRGGDLAVWKPDIAIFDLLIRYFSPADLSALEAAPEIDHKPAPERAGDRCAVRMQDQFPKTRIAIVTVLNPAQLSAKAVEVFQKGADRFKEELFRFLRLT
jgi:hypothetical protein